MASESSRQRLEALAAQAHGRAARQAAELERRRGLPAGPGDLFVLPATADLPVEWAILEAGAGGKLLAVPADSGPPAGTADVEVPADAPGGPLSLRCRFAVWLDKALFEPELRSGVLAPETVAEALHCSRQAESGNRGGSPLAQEVDADPEYQDWIREVPQRARALAARPSRAPIAPRSSFRSWGVPHSLAAAFALVAVGLSLWVGALRHQVERLSEPIFDPPSGEIMLGEVVRGETTLPMPRVANHILLVFTTDPSIDFQDGYLEIVNRAGKSIWRSTRVRLTPGGELPLILPRQLLPYGDYRVRVFPEAGFGVPPLTEEPLRVEIAE
ncbi:MAG TPA: hypothetical protein VKK31_10975 [Thermoanaerobaculia bacterium]|nr:hypothetical protein [Thermoanaerobaculia bacterium]